MVAVFLLHANLLVSPLSVSAAPMPVKRIVMDNGMVLLVSPQHSLPIVQIKMIIKSGALRDPAGKEGLAYLVAELLDEGTIKRSSTEIADQIDFVGGSLGTGGGSDWASASLRVLKKDIHLGLDLLSDVLLDPIFPEAELKRTRNEILAGLVAEKDEPGVVAGRAFNKLLFGAHPYHRPAQGTEESLPAITQRDLVDFHKLFYRPNNTIMAVVGDVTEDEAEKLIAQYFGKWKSDSIPDLQVQPPSQVKDKVIKLIDKDLTQANIILGHLGIDRKNPDYYSVIVMNYILGGGGFSSRLLTEIRDNRGLAYSVYSRFNARLHPGDFAARLQTKNVTAQEAIDGVIREIDKIRNQPVSNSELKETKAFLVGSFPLRMDTIGKIANLLTQIEYFDLGLDYFEEYTEKIKAVNQDDIQRVARKYLSTEKFILVVVANQDSAKISAVQ